MRMRSHERRSTVWLPALENRGTVRRAARGGAARCGERAASLARLCLLLVALGAACARPGPPAAEVRPAPTLALAPCAIAKSTSDARCGTHPVFEDRAARSGRVI